MPRAANTFAKAADMVLWPSSMVATRLRLPSIRPNTASSRLMKR